ncbi:MAG: hypothetical protein RPT95_10310 [Candidatus Sedimenticola sp. (ex Thyasira tokunagai)]
MSMQYYRFIIGIQLNKKMFRLSSSSGLLVDEILNLRDTEKKIGEDYFTQIGISNNPDDLYVSFSNEDKSNTLLIKSDQIVFKKTAIDNVAAVVSDKAHQEFEILWKKADGILSFPAVRRIGMVGELRIDESGKNSAANELVKRLVKINPPEHSGRFQLTYENKRLKNDGSVPDKETDDYWNTIYTYYLSEHDETPVSGKINANIDVQKYYNPAKSNPLAELKKVKSQFAKEKSAFKTSLSELGFSKNGK